MNKKVLVSSEFVTDVYRLCGILTTNVSPEIQTLVDRITSVIDEKIDRDKRREFYSKSKLAESPEERQQAKNSYYDLTGIHKDFRY